MFQIFRAAAAAILLSFIVAFASAAAAQTPSAHDMSGGHDMMSHTGTGDITVAVLLYDGALVLDYGIAAEMFLAADYMRAFNVYTVSETGSANISILGATTTLHTFDDAPTPDIVIVPGGPLWQQAGNDPEVIAFLEHAQDEGAVLYSVCTGALLLAEAGFLDGREATTLHGAGAMIPQLAEGATYVDTTYVDSGNVVTAAGAGTAIETTLHMVRRFAGDDVANDLRDRYLNYPHEG